MTSKKLALIDQVNERFNAQENLKDLAILYEITGFQDEVPDDGDFWSNYGNFKVIGATQMAINDIKVGDWITFFSNKLTFIVFQYFHFFLLKV